MLTVSETQQKLLPIHVWLVRRSGLRSSQIRIGRVGLHFLRQTPTQIEHQCNCPQPPPTSAGILTAIPKLPQEPVPRICMASQATRRAGDLQDESDPWQNKLSVLAFIGNKQTKISTLHSLG